MTAVIDTNSLLSLVRYYLPFDGKRLLANLLENKLESGELILLDKVLEECGYLSGGIILKELDVLKDSQYLVKTDELIPSPAFHRILDNQLCYRSKRNAMSEEEYESRKLRYLNSADAALILYCYEGNRNGGHACLVSEESASENDSKLFKKLPTICKVLSINYQSLPYLLRSFNNEVTIAIEACSKKINSV